LVQIDKCSHFYDKTLSKIIPFGFILLEKKMVYFIINYIFLLLFFLDYIIPYQ